MTDLNPFTKNAEYLKELMYEKQMLSNINHGNGLFLVHTARLLEHEIARLHSEVFRTQFPGETDVSLQLPEPEGEVVSIQDKVYIPKEPKNYNYVGRILGPRGMTAKDLEVLTGTKIQIRGRGSLRDPEKEEINRSIFGWEHLNDELHVLIECEDTPNRAKIRVENAKKLVTDLLKIPEDGVDDLKRKQLLGLAVINGNLRTCPQRPFSTSQLRQCRVFTPVASTASYSDNSFSTQAPFSPTYQPLLYSPYNPPVQRQAFSTPHSPYPAYFSPTHSSRSVFTPSPPAYLHTQQSLKSPDSAISSVERLDRSFHQRLNISGQEYPTTPRSTRSYKIGNSDGSVYSNWRHREPKPKHLKHVQQDPEAALNPVLKDLLGPARPDSPPLPSLLDHFNESAGKGSSAKN